jgi:hypothetical protein
MTSPAMIPALAAGLSFCASLTSAPSAFLRPRLSAMSAVTAWIWTPIQPRVTWPEPLSWTTTDLTVSAGMSNPMPPPVGWAARSRSATDTLPSRCNRRAGCGNAGLEQTFDNGHTRRLALPRGEILTLRDDVTPAARQIEAIMMAH